MKKKKRKTVVPATPGKACQYLIDNFSPVPDGTPLKKGHVMLLYVQNEYSIKQTIDAVKEKIKITCAILPHQLKSVTDILLKYRQQTRDMLVFAGKCDECFDKFHIVSETSGEMPMEVDEQPSSQLEQSQSEPQPGTSLDYVPPSPEEHPPPEPEIVVPVTPGPFIPSTPGSAVRRSRQQLTPMKKALKRRLFLECKAKKDLKKTYIHTTKLLRTQLQSERSIKIKYLNQDRARLKVTLAKKDARIAQLQKDITENAAGLELERTKIEMRELKRAHKRLLQVNKLKRTTTASAIVSVEEHSELQNIIKNKDDEIVDLQNEKLIFEEIIRDLQMSRSEVKSSKKDGQG